MSMHEQIKLGLLKDFRSILISPFVHSYKKAYDYNEIYE